MRFPIFERLWRASRVQCAFGSQWGPLKLGELENRASGSRHLCGKLGHDGCRSFTMDEARFLGAITGTGATPDSSVSVGIFAVTVLGH